MINLEGSKGKIFIPRIEKEGDESRGHLIQLALI